MQIDINPDNIVIDQHTFIQRPSYIARSIWMAFWERVKKIRI